MANPPSIPPPAPNAPPEKNCASQGVPEGALAATLGVARDDLKKLRDKLTPFLDWIGGKGAPILITEAGQAKLQSLLSASDGTVAAAVTQLGTERYSSLTVTRIGSSRILMARRPDASEGEPLQRVMVRTSANFLPGMVLEKCQPARTAGLWYFHGRLPRQKGRF